MNATIGLVIVTFNRNPLLFKSIDALLKGTLVPDRIVVVDNNTDKKLTDEIAQFIKKNSNIEIITGHGNIGAAKAFSVGMAQISKKVDYLWLHDDDVVPKSDCLELLYQESSKNKIAVVPAREYVNGQEHEFVQMINFATGSKTRFRNVREDVFINVGCFEGLFFPAKYLDEIIVDFEKYFIGEDDTIFGVNLSLVCPIKYVYRAKMIRQLYPPDAIAAWKAFYVVRNQLFLFGDLKLFTKNYSKVNFAVIIFIILRKILTMTVKNPKCLFPALKGALVGLFYVLALKKDNV